MRKISMKGLLMLLSTLVLTFAFGILTFAYNEGDGFEVTGDTVNVRSEASSDSSKVTTVTKGNKVTYVGEGTDGEGATWYKVKLSNGSEGYIKSDFLKAVETAPADDQSAEGGEDASAGDQATEGTEGSEGGDAPAVEEQGNYTMAGTGTLLAMESEGTPEGISSEFTEIYVNINGTEVPAWQKDEYLVFYAQGPSGDVNWYMYDKTYGGFIRYNAFMGGGSASDNDAGSSEGVSKVLFIVVLVICVILVIVSSILGIKLINKGNEKYDYDDDDDDDDEGFAPKKKSGKSFFSKLSNAFSDEDDDDEDDDEDDDDDDDDEEDERPVRRPVNAARPAGQGARPQGARPAGQGARPQGQARPVSQRPVQTRPVQDDFDDSDYDE